jgi:hypothetical protein
VLKNGASILLITLAQTKRAICLWLSGLRAKYGMLPLLAHEVRLARRTPNFRRLVAEPCLPFNVFDALPLHTFAAAYSGPITTGHNALL